MAFFKSYADFHSYLEGLNNRGVSPSLTGIKALCQALGHPEQKLRVVQVVGTNGKTTTARALGLILAQHGLSTGIYTSPHLISYTERYELNGRSVNAAQLIKAANKVKEAQVQVEAKTRLHSEDKASSLSSERFYDQPKQAQKLVLRTEPQARHQQITQFEFLTALAFVLFTQAQVDVAVLEAGMGARWDATSVVWPEVGVLTNVSYDHLDFLGPNLKQIAAEKAYIIRGGNQVVMGQVDNNIKSIFIARAEQENAQLYWENEDFIFWSPNAVSGSVMTSNSEQAQTFNVKGIYSFYNNLQLNLKGAWQVGNIAKAVVAAELVLKKPLKKEALACLANLKAPGRAEEVTFAQTRILLDGAHNLSGIVNLIKLLDNYPQDKIFLVSIMADKEVLPMLKTILSNSRKQTKLIFTQCSQERAANPWQFQSLLSSDPRVILEANLQKALNLALEQAGREKLLVICGSLYLVGEVKKALKEKALLGI